MQPTEGAHASKAAGQNVLKKTAHELEGLEFDGSPLAGLTVAIGPEEVAVGSDFDSSIAGGGFEDVTRQVAEGVFSGTSMLSADIPRLIPNAIRDHGVEIRVGLEETLSEESAKAGAEGLVMEKEFSASSDPGASVEAEPAGRDQIVDVGMINESARPGMEYAKHAQLGSESAGICRQILQGARAGRKEQIQGELLMGTDDRAQGVRDGKGDQEVRDGQKQAGTLTRQPVVGVGLTALGTVAVVAGMIAVVNVVTVRADKELPTPSRSAAGEDL